MKYFWLLLITVITVSCNNETPSLNDNAIAKPNDFIKAFSNFETSTVLTDSNISNYNNNNINEDLLLRFVNTNVVKTLCSNQDKCSFKAIGKISKATESYILLLCKQTKVSTLHVLVFNKDNVFEAQQQIAIFGNKDSEYKQMVSINKEPTFFINKQKLNADREVKFTKIGLAYTNNKFTEVYKETNEGKHTQEVVINPIETMLAQNTLSGDYILNEKNFISLRDGSSKNKYVFFLHIDKNDGLCVGEIKGELDMKDSVNGIYNAAGDPCHLAFNFSGRVVTIKEDGTCGNRRGPDCKFDESYLRKKVDLKKLSKKPLIVVPQPEVKIQQPSNQDVKLNNNKSILKQLVPKETINPEKNKKQDKDKVKPKTNNKPKAKTESNNPYE